MALSNGSGELLDSAHSSPNLVLSSDRLSCVSTLDTEITNVSRGTIAYSSGKKYREIAVVAAGGVLSTVGLVGGNFIIGTHEMGRSAGSNSCTYYVDGGFWVSDVGYVGDVDRSLIGGDLLSEAIDFDAKLAWYRLNNGLWNVSATANPATGVGGHSFASLTLPLYRAIENQNLNVTMTVNFGASAFVKAVPAGFLF